MLAASAEAESAAAETGAAVHDHVAEFEAYRSDVESRFAATETDGDDRLQQMLRALDALTSEGGGADVADLVDKLPAEDDAPAASDADIAAAQAQAGYARAQSASVAAEPG